MCEATSHLGTKIRKSARGVEESEEGTVRTQTGRSGLVRGYRWGREARGRGRTDGGINVIYAYGTDVDETV